MNETREPWRGAKPRRAKKLTVAQYVWWRFKDLMEKLGL